MVTAGRDLKILYSAIALAILVLITYQGAGRHQFVGWDDSEYVSENPLVKNTSEFDLKAIFSTVISLNYHPVTIMSMRINSNKCKDCPDGISARPFIQGNILLHILNSILVLIMLWLLSGRRILAPLLTAALFAVHPMHVESVAWVSERKDVLYTFFFLSGVITYLIFIGKKNGGYGWLAVTFLLFVLSCLSKAVAVVFPVVLILVNFMSYGKDDPGGWKESMKNALSRRNLLLMAPFFAVSVFFGLMAVSVQKGHNFLGMLQFIKEPNDVVNLMGSLSAVQHFQTGSYGFMVYLSKFIFPVNQSPFYPYPTLQEFSHGPFSAQLWLASAAMLLILFLTVRSLRKTKLIFFCMAFYFITIALVLQFVSVGSALLAERYSYLPYIGIAFLPATIIAGTPEKIRRVLLIISGFLIIVLILIARHQVKVWSNSGTLWSQVIEQHPKLELPRRARGKYYYLLSSKAKSITEKNHLEEKALADFDIAMMAGTKDASVYDATGVLLMNRGDLNKALECLDKAVSLKPTEGGIYYNRAMVYDGLGMKDKAIKDYSSALGLDPGLSIKALSNKAVLLTETGRFAMAERDLNRLIAADPANFMYYYNRAYVRVRQDNAEGAISDYKSVLRLQPGNEDAARELQLLIDNGIK